MELVTFHERIYGKYQTKLFVFEPTWDSFRPISGIGWDGSKFAPIDSVFKKNIFDSVYGYGSIEQQSECRKLIQETELSESKLVEDPLFLWKWYGEKNVKWWRDRPCVFLNSCTSRSPESWKEYLRYLNVRAKTLRRPFRGRSTKRLLPK
jgi:hypothetical protein